MTDILTKMVNLGLGLAAVSKDKAESVVSELVKRGSLSRDEAEGVVQELVERGEESRGKIHTTLVELVERTVHGMNLPTASDLAKLEARISALEARFAARE